MEEKEGKLEDVQQISPPPPPPCPPLFCDPLTGGQTVGIAEQETPGSELAAAAHSLPSSSRTPVP